MATFPVVGNTLLSKQQMGSALSNDTSPNLNARKSNHFPKGDGLRIDHT
jgi:hypothetical protein